MKKLLLALGAMAAAAVINAGAGTVVAQSKDPVVLGGLQILTGPQSRYGVANKQGIDLAVEEINAAGGILGGRKIVIQYEDTAAVKEQAVNATRKLIGRDKVPVIFGATTSGDMFAAAPVANERKVVIIGSSTTAAGITAIGPFVFRTAVPESDVLPVTMKTAQDKLGIKKVAVMYANDNAFSKSGYDTFKEVIEKLGLTTLTTETFAEKDSDFSAQLTKIKALNPDAIVVSSQVEAASGILLQARSLGIDPKVRVIGGNGLNSSKLMEIAGKAAEGSLVGSPWFLSKKTPPNEKFIAAFRAKYNTDPDQFSAQAYDTVYIVAEAINRAGSLEGDKIREALYATKHDGVLGMFSFTKDRDPADTSGILVLQVKDGAFQIFQ